MKTSSIIFRLLFFLGLVPFSHLMVAQNVSKTALLKTWRLEKYYEEGEYYEPEANEVNDFIELKGDMTFNAMLEGELYSGSWMVNTNGAYVELKYTTDEIDKLRIKWLGKRTLVVIFDADFYRYTEVHYYASQK
ncbi:hypothetical protein J8281_12025 [Aquimarina sp. U1-2]|uniref:hypothetical protein n=1 Tax=Aquimarina sp. U1-2 TaxID=2823141 RepID=UPI001AED03CB|nr:hypothetical protein [Aquimarina sp. U1-2]MBP2832914.1 hypothetical protein [Aquimarina sp. U1-2]